MRLVGALTIGVSLLLLCILLLEPADGALLSRKQERLRDAAADKVRSAKRRLLDEDDDEGWNVPVVDGLVNKLRGSSAVVPDELLDDAGEIGKKYTNRLGKHFDKLKDDHADLLAHVGKKYVDKAALAAKDAKRRYVDGEKGWRVPVISTIKDKFRRGDAVEDLIDDVAELGKKYVDQAGTRLKEDTSLSDDSGEELERLGNKGKRYAKQAGRNAQNIKRRFVEEDEDEDEDEDSSWHIPILSGIADRFRGQSSDDESEGYLDEAGRKAKQAKRYFYDELDDDDDDDNEGSSWRIPVLSGIADKFRGSDTDDAIDDAKDKGKQYADRAGKKLKKSKDGLSDAADKAEKKGKQYIDDAAVKAKDMKRRYVDGEKGWRIPVISSIRDSFRSSDASEDLIDDISDKGKKYVRQVAKNAKSAKDKYASDIDDAADKLSKKGKQYADAAAKKMKNAR
jgi:gas vesicle protein